MNSLEWINAEIENTKTYLGIAQCNEVMFGDENNEVYKMFNNKLNHLHQIKTELEAWEVVKKYVKEISINGIAFEHIINVSHTKQNYEIVKKALEGKEND